MVEDIQVEYVNYLEKYQKAKRKGGGGAALARFINKSLSDLRNISFEYSKLLVELDEHKQVNLDVPSTIKEFLLPP